MCSVSPLCWFLAKYCRRLLILPDTSHVKYLQLNLHRKFGSEQPSSSVPPCTIDISGNR